MQQKPPSILVVDDDEDTCLNLSDILTDLDYRVDIAHNGQAALELVRQNTYDVALLDLKMPGMDGLTLYREIKKLQAGTVGIVVTAYASGQTTTEALEAGAWQVVAKPVEIPELMSVIEDVIDQPLVLVVDDDPDLLENLWQILHQDRYRACLAHDEQEAAKRLAERDYGIVLIDMKLGAGNGGNVFRMVRDANPEARTILITGHRDELEQTVQNVIKEGADAVCYKPFDVAGLLKTIKRLVRS